MRGCSDAIVGRLGGINYDTTSSKEKDVEHVVANQDQPVMRGLAYYSTDLVEKTSHLLSSKANGDSGSSATTTASAAAAMPIVPKPNLTRGTTSDSTTSSSGTTLNTVTIRHHSISHSEFECPDSSKIWSSLEKCDAFHAAGSIAVGTLILATNSSDFDPLNINKDLVAIKYIDSKLLSAVNECCLHEEIANTYAKKVTQGAKECIFLRQTVLDDIDLIILEGSANVIEKAKCLAAVGILSGKSQGELMGKFLDSTEIVLDDITEGLVSKDIEINQLNDKLISAINILQSTLLDIYTIFFKQTDNSQYEGILTYYEKNFIDNLTMSMKLFIKACKSRLNSKEKIFAADMDNGKEYSDVGFDEKEFLKDVSSTSSKSQLRGMFDAWLSKVIVMISSRCKVALSVMESAFEVAKLQQRMWQACCSVSSSIDSSDNDNAIVYTQADWVSTCKMLLDENSKIKRGIKKSGSKDGSDGSNNDDSNSASQLWTAVFRAPFMVQVERLLQQSCYAVMLRAKSQLFDALAAEGLIVDSNTLNISIHGSSSSTTVGGGSGSNKTRSNLLNVDIEAAEWMPSPRIFRRAEYVRALLEEEITDMFGEIVSPVNEGDTTTTAAFTRAMFIQCSQLAGQLAVLLRCLTKQCKDLLDKKLKTASPISLSDMPEISPLMSGLLIVGRLAWLLKIRGRFIEEALVQSSGRSPQGKSMMDSGSSSISSNINMADLSTEEQLLSAFEIADTDGDGIVTNAEAIEAIQALSVGSMIDFNTPPQYLHPSVSPSFSFNEFVLVCNNLIHEDESHPLSRFRVCIDDIIKASHDTWSIALIDTLKKKLDLSMRLELLGIDTVFDGTIKPENLFGKAYEMSSTLSSEEKKKLCIKKFNVTNRKLKSSWVKETLEMEDVMVPTGLSASLSEFLFSISKQSSGSLLSVDTIQEMPMYTIFDTSPPSSSSSGGSIGDKGERNSRLADEGLYSVLSNAISIIASHYNALRKDVDDLVSAQKAKLRKDRGIKQPRQKEPISIDDVALQVIFDLLVCEGIFGKLRTLSRAVSQKVGALNDCLEGWQDAVDPVNAQLLLPLMKTKTTSYLSRIHLIFPGLSHGLNASSMNNANTTSSNDATTSNAVSGFFSESPSSRFSLLPLALTTTGKGGAILDNQRDGSKNKDGGSKKAETVGSTLQKGVASAAAASSSNGSWGMGIGNVSLSNLTSGFLGDATANTSTTTKSKSKR